MRRQRPRGTITQDAVIDAALIIVDRAKVDGLTIRAVARQVGAPPMSLYSHFANKEQLLDLMYGEIVRRMYPDQGHASWQSELFALCQHIRSLLLEHPNWTALLARLAAQRSVPVRERILAMMVADGIGPDVALMAFSGAVISSTGFVLGELTLRTSEGESTLAHRYERLREWSETTEDAPVTSSAMAKTARYDADAVFLFTLRALVQGISVPRASAVGT
jgi:AcrR family transcriptional regulator